LEHVRNSEGAHFRILSEREDIDKFNDRGTNLRGERYRVFVGETGECGEGTSFFNVRKLYLLDAPANATEFEQRIARVDRGDGHRGLPEHERTVEVEISCAMLPEVLRSPLGSWVWRELMGSAATAHSAQQWRSTLRRAEKVVRCFTRDLGISQSSSRCLFHLRDRIQELDEHSDNDSEMESSDAKTCAEQKRAIKKLRLKRGMLERLGRMDDAMLDKLSRSLCTATVDEQILREELPSRCIAVKEVHAPLRAIAMDASFCG